MLDGILKLQNFFNASLDTVDELLLYMAMTGIRPLWLEGRTEIQHLPRFSKEKFEVGFYIGSCDLQTLSERIEWVVNTLEGGWRLDGNYMYIETDGDLVYYRLRWEDKPKKFEKSS